MAPHPTRNQKGSGRRLSAETQNHANGAYRPRRGSPTKDLNFKVSPEFRRGYKGIAADLDIPMKGLLEEMAQCWLKHCANDRHRAMFRSLTEKRDSDTEGH